MAFFQHAKKTLRTVVNHQDVLLLFLALAVTVPLFLIGCLGRATGPAPAAGLAAGVPGARTPPPLALPAIDDSAAPAASFVLDGECGAIFTAGAAAQGIVAARCISDRRARLVIEAEGLFAAEDLPADGDWHFYPLVAGSGTYTLSLCLQRGGDWYEVAAQATLSVTVASPMQCYLMPNYLVDYRADSRVVELARQFYAESADDAAMVAAAAAWVHQYIQYDEASVDNVMETYTDYYRPDLDRLVEEGTGICSDYASLFAAILRINGVPCRLLYGSARTADGLVPHAWNQVWLEDGQGGGQWWRYDPTFGLAPVPLAGTEDNPALPEGNIVYSAPQAVH